MTGAVHNLFRFDSSNCLSGDENPEIWAGGSIVLYPLGNSNNIHPSPAIPQPIYSRLVVLQPFHPGIWSRIPNAGYIHLVRIHLCDPPIRIGTIPHVTPGKLLVVHTSNNEGLGLYTKGAPVAI